MIKTLLFIFIISASIPLWSVTVFAAQFFDKTSYDTLQQTLRLTTVVKKLWQINAIQTVWPIVQIHGSKSSQHEYQKALEVLSKINRYRLIKKMGAVSMPSYPSREITPNEVFDLIQRLVNEVDVLLPSNKYNTIDVTNTSHLVNLTNLDPKTSRAINYQQLWIISKAFDPLLGVRGFTPADVFAQSEHIVDLVRFLRLTQNIILMPKKPKKLTGKHPNHALAAARQLLLTIRSAESNLWMPAVEVQAMKKRVVTPTEVYDELQTVITELQRIKFRLGVERTFSQVVIQADKTPDDVMQNLQWATAAMPQFPLNRPLQQHDAKYLEKTPNDVFAIAHLVLKKLRAYKKMCGIRKQATQPALVTGLKPQHVYQKTLESLKKVIELRSQVGFSASAMPLFPMRLITPNDVFTLVSRLNDELDIIYAKSGMPVDRYKFIADVDMAHKTPSDVFAKIWQISYELDTLLGTQGQTPDDVLQIVIHVENHIKLIAAHLGYELQDIIMPTFKKGLQPKDVIEKAQDVLKLIAKIQQRAGMFIVTVPIPNSSKIISPNDVFNLVGVIVTELTALEIHFAITKQLPFPAAVRNKTPSHVYQYLTYTESLLHRLLAGGHEHE